MPSAGIGDIDRLIAPGRYVPRWGWHDDHRNRDKTPGYLPAIQQVRGEFAQLLWTIQTLPQRHAALQLGMGPCRACHDAWLMIFAHVATIDYSGTYSDTLPAMRGCSTHDSMARTFAALHSPFDLLFIDAGHTEEDVTLDYVDYAPYVRDGGLIVFHDALPRKGYPELGVYKFLERFEGVTMIGQEVGTAWIRKSS